MAKCVSCNLCMEYAWENEKRILFCPLCGRKFTVRNGKLVELVVKKSEPSVKTVVTRLPSKTNKKL